MLLSHLAHRYVPRVALLAAAACFACMTGSVAARAEDAGAAPPAAEKPPENNTMVSLINRLAERGALTKQDAADLVVQAEADAADAKVRAAEAALAVAKAEAAAARARADAARAIAALARSQAATNQMAQNQAAAVRALLGQPAGPVAAVAAAPATPMESPPPERGEVESLPAPVVQSRPIVANPAPAPMAEETPPPLAAPRPAHRAPAPPPVAAPPPLPADATPTDVVAAATAAATPPPPAPDPAEAGLVAEAPVATAAEAPVVPVPSDTGTDLTTVSPGAAKDADDTPVTPAAAPGPSELIVRNADGAIVVPEDAPTAAAPAAQSPTATGRDADQVNEAGTKDPEAAPASTDSSPAAPAEPPVALGDAGAAAPPRTAAEAPAAMPDTIPDPAAPAGSGDDVVRVPYVPEVVKRQIRDEVKNEVLAEARKENWGSPSSGPEWVSKFTLYGDIRLRVEEVINHAGNNDTGAFPDFNAINTGAPFDTAGNVFSPQYDVNANRNRERLRARLGAIVDLQDGFTAGFRLATGNDNNPVTENQTFGAAGGAQGGDFAKYAVWIDRAYVKFQSTGGDKSWAIYAGRFDNPFFATPLIWANDIGFDGIAMAVPVAAHLNNAVAEDLKPFLVVGAFPVFNTDLNYSTNDPVKFQSYDKWLFAGQIGFDAKVNDDYDFKLAAALYQYHNIQGQLSSPFVPLNTSDAGDTDASRPSFAQNGNTYMAIRDITPTTSNDEGTIDQYQYYGLASKFKEFAVTEKLTYHHFDPFEVSLMAEWVRNLAFDRSQISAEAVNNGGTTDYIGGNTGWIATLQVGTPTSLKLGDWNASVGYRYLQSDAVVDAFNDADFGGALTGTNLKGLTVTAAVGIANDIWLEARWFSATAIAGPTYKNDLLQLDLNAKF